MTDITKFLDYEYYTNNKSQYFEKLLQSDNLTKIKIAILSGSTIGELTEILNLFLLNHGIKAEFWEGSYNRIFEEACFENKELEKFEPDYIYIHMTNKNTLFYRQDDKNISAKLAEEKEHLQFIWKQLKERYGCIVIQNNLEYPKYRICGNASRYLDKGSVYYIDALNAFIHKSIEESKHIFLNDINYLSSWLGLNMWYDDRLWYLYKYAVSMKALPYIGYNISNVIKSTLGKNKKAIISDLDNTLWGGIIGEAGNHSIDLGHKSAKGEMFSNVQRYLGELGKYGVSLNICSKNNYETGLSGFNNPESSLKKEDFDIIKINWQDKYSNINELLLELNILAESAVFLDDSLVECDSVHAFIPEIAIIFAETPILLLDNLEWGGFFEITYESKEDSIRSQLNQENMLREKECQKFKNYGEYLDSLDMKCTFCNINSDNIERSVQLINKTNQFNFTGKKTSIIEMEKILTDSSIITLTASLKDKFGAYGLVSVLIGRIEGQDFHIKQWVMSCRVFKRTLEYAVLNEVISLCKKKKLTCIYGYYYKTNKNSHISDFYQIAGFEKSCSPLPDCWKLEVNKPVNFKFNMECKNKLHDT